MCQSTNTSNDLMTYLHAAADLVGPMSFAALSFLIAALAIFRDLKEDRFSISPRYFQNLKTVVYVLSAEVILWCALFVQRAFSPFSGSVGDWVVTISVSVMVAGVALVAVYLAGFVSAVIRFVGSPVQSNRQLPKG